MMDILACISLNASGFNNPLKRHRVFKYLLAEQINIVCIQGTHLKLSDEIYFREVYRGTIYHAPAPNKTRGIMLGISKRLLWACDNLELDPNVWFIIADGNVGGRNLTIIGVTAQTWDR